MSVRWLVDFPALRTAPDHLRARLRELDPTAEIVYFGDGNWLVGRVRPNALVVRQCIRMIDNAVYSLASGKAKRLSRSGVRKIQLATLGLQGFRPVAEYFVQGIPTNAIALDFERSQWLMHHTTDDEVIDSIFADQDRQREANLKDLTDPGRAHDAWRYAFTRSHGVTDYSNRSTLKSGRTLVRSIS